MGVWDIINRDEYEQWAQTADEPCIHNYLKEHLLEVLQHDSKIYAGKKSQENQHEQKTENITMVTA